MADLLGLAADPTAWVALVTLIIMEIVLGVDNLVFVSILSNRVASEKRQSAQRIGLGLALLMRLALLLVLAWIVSLTQPIFTVFGHAFSWKDLILIAGGLFLVYKATTEMHERIEPRSNAAAAERSGAHHSLSTAIIQICALNLVFSLDSIITAMGMTNEIPIMMVAVIVSVGLMIVAAGPLSRFINRKPTVVMLALGFLLMIGMTLIADGFGLQVPKGYIYAAMAFSGFVEVMNQLARRGGSTART
ncbi:TerC family protein [Microbacterium sp. ARD31]|jgi:predicted tellurium resistance membrane protein TerC|uniref:TerC family protein n=1 Tax=Methylobacterium fujisawaense TaxID=107400 RepID=UPI0028828BC1|nr:TerC family protein [Microbacterium sp. ARD31]MDT0187980.1 TerC family protein [Microbacterium sp. ARD31]MDV2987902.1 TerC family protein [Methylobacteriaceae bacterium AG10]